MIKKTIIFIITLELIFQPLFFNFGLKEKAKAQSAPNFKIKVFLGASYFLGPLEKCQAGVQFDQFSPLTPEFLDKVFNDRCLPPLPAIYFLFSTNSNVDFNDELLCKTIASSTFKLELPISLPLPFSPNQFYITTSAKTLGFTTNYFTTNDNKGACSITNVVDKDSGNVPIPGIKAAIIKKGEYQGFYVFLLSQYFFKNYFDSQQESFKTIKLYDLDFKVFYNNTSTFEDHKEFIYYKDIYDFVNDKDGNPTNELTGTFPTYLEVLPPARLNESVLSNACSYKKSSYEISLYPYTISWGVSDIYSSELTVTASSSYYLFSPRCNPPNLFDNNFSTSSMCFKISNLVEKNSNGKWEQKGIAPWVRFINGYAYGTTTFDSSIVEKVNTSRSSNSQDQNPYLDSSVIQSFSSKYYENIDVANECSLVSVQEENFESYESGQTSIRKIYYLLCKNNYIFKLKFPPPDSNYYYSDEYFIDYIKSNVTTPDSNDLASVFDPSLQKTFNEFMKGVKIVNVTDYKYPISTDTIPLLQNPPSLQYIASTSRLIILSPNSDKKYGIGLILTIERENYHSVKTSFAAEAGVPRIYAATTSYYKFDDLNHYLWFFDKTPKIFIVDFEGRGYFGTFDYFAQRCTLPHPHSFFLQIRPFNTPAFFERPFEGDPTYYRDAESSWCYSFQISGNRPSIGADIELGIRVPDINANDDDQTKIQKIIRQAFLAGELGDKSSNITSLSFYLQKVTTTVNNNKISVTILRDNYLGQYEARDKVKNIFSPDFKTYLYNLPRYFVLKDSQNSNVKDDLPRSTEIRYHHYILWENVPMTFWQAFWKFMDFAALLISIITFTEGAYLTYTQWKVLQTVSKAIQITRILYLAYSLVSNFYLCVSKLENCENVLVTGFTLTFSYFSNSLAEFLSKINIPLELTQLGTSAISLNMNRLIYQLFYNKPHELLNELTSRYDKIKELKEIEKKIEVLGDEYAKLITQFFSTYEGDIELIYDYQYWISELLNKKEQIIKEIEKIEGKIEKIKFTSSDALYIIDNFISILQAGGEEQTRIKDSLSIYSYLWRIPKNVIFESGTYQLVAKIDGIKTIDPILNTSIIPSILLLAPNPPLNENYAAFLLNIDLPTCQNYSPSKPEAGSCRQENGLIIATGTPGYAFNGGWIEYFSENNNLCFSYANTDNLIYVTSSPVEFDKDIFITGQTDKKVLLGIKLEGNFIADSLINATHTITFYDNSTTSVSQTLNTTTSQFISPIELLITHNKEINTKEYSKVPEKIRILDEFSLKPFNTSRYFGCDNQSNATALIRIVTSTYSYFVCPQGYIPYYDTSTTTNTCLGWKCVESTPQPSLELIP